MSSSLMDRVKSRLAKAKVDVSREEFEVLYSTGFVGLDYLNGTMVHVNGNKINTSYRSTGIVDGSVI